MLNSTRDPDRALGESEQLAVKILKQPLVHNISTGEEVRHERADQMHLLRLEGWTLQEVGDAWGMSREAIRQELARYNIAPVAGRRRRTPK